jgi:PAS domain S-box-containing protein
MRAERNRRRVEERMLSLVQATAAVYWSTDANGRLTEDSPSWRGFTGQTYDQIVGLGWLNSVHADDRQRVIEAWDATILDHRPFEMEHRLRARDGLYRSVLTRAAPVIPDGQIREWVGLTVDVTALRSAEDDRDALAEQLALVDDRQRKLQKLTALLADALTVPEVATVAVRDAPNVIGAEGALVVVRRDDGELRPTASLDAPVITGARWRVIAADAEFPAAQTARSGKALLVDGPDDWSEVAPSLAIRYADEIPKGAVDTYPLFVDDIALEQAHEVVLEGQVEPGLAGVTLTTGTTSQLVVDPARLVALGAKHVQPPEVGHLVVLGRD